MFNFIIEKDENLRGWTIKRDDNRPVAYDHSMPSNGRSITELVIADTTLSALIEKVKNQEVR